MAINNVIGVTVDVNSQNLVVAEQRASKLNKTLNQVGAPRKIGGSSAAAKASDQTDYAVTRGITGQTGAAGRDFAKQAQGLGGLVHLYATFAANIFAVSMAFTAFDRAFQYQKMIEGAKVLESTTGVALRSIASNMTKVSDGALSMQESLKFTALASSAGISTGNIEKLTKVAKGASLALGRDMGDAIDRIIRGVSKLEPELIDELGITVKSMQAYRDYAKQLGVSTESLTNYQKTAAYTQAVILEGTRKFGDVANQIEASPFNKVMGELKNSAITLANIFNNVLTPILSVFANNVELVYAGILLTIKSLAIRALPEMTKLFSVPPEAIAKQEAQITRLLASMKDSNTAKLTMAAETATAEVNIQREKIAKMKTLATQQVNDLAPGAFKNPNGQAAKNLTELSSIDSLNRDTRLRSTINAGITREKNLQVKLSRDIAREERGLNKFNEQNLILKQEQLAAEANLARARIGATAEQKALNNLEKQRILDLKLENQKRAETAIQVRAIIAGMKEELALSNARLGNLTQINAIIAQNTLEMQGATATQRQLLILENERLLAIRSAAVASNAQKTSTLAEIALLEHRLVLAKLNRDQAVQTALFTEGKQRAEIVRAEKQLEVDIARQNIARNSRLLTSAVVIPATMGPNGARIAAIVSEERAVNSLGRAYVTLGGVMDGLKAKAVTLGATISRAMGALGIIVMVLYALYAATKFVLNSFDMLNKYSADLSDALKDNENVLHTATAAYTKYSELQKETGYSTTAIIDANSIAAATFDQVTESINKQIDAFKTWQANQTGLSAWWDQAFGTSNFDKLRTNLSKQLDAASKFAPNKQVQKDLKVGSVEVLQKKSIEELINIKNKYNGILFKEAEQLKNTNNAYKTLSDGVKTANIALKEFYKKDDIKNANIRTVVEKIDEIINTKDMTVKLRVLAGIEKDSPLYNLIPEALQKVIDKQVEVQNNAKAILAIEQQAIDSKAAAQAKPKDKAEESLTYWLDKKEAYYIQLMQNSLANLYRSMVDGIKEYFTKLGTDFYNAVTGVNFTNWAETVTKSLSAALMLAIPGIAFLFPTGDDLNSARKAQAEGRAEANAKKPLTAAEQAKTEAQRQEALRAKAERDAISDLQAKESKLYGDRGGRPREKPKTESMSLDEIDANLKKVKVKATALDDKNTRGSNSDNKLKKLQEELKLIKTTTEGYELDNKLAEKRIGYAGEENILATYASKKSEEQLQYQIDIHNIEKARESAGRNSKLTSSEIRINEKLALEAAGANYRLRLRNLDIQKQEALIADKMKDYDATKAFANKWELQAEQTSLDLLVASNSLTEKEIRDKTDALAIKSANLELSRAQAAFDVDNNNHTTSTTLALAIQNKARVEGLILAKQGVESEKDSAKVLDRRLEMVSLIQDLSDKAYPDAQINKALILKKAEYDRNNILLEHNQNLGKNQDIAEKIKNTKLETLEIEKRIALHEQNKKDFTNLSATDRVQTLYDEASKQAADFARNMKDAVTGTFDAVYAGMDAAIDELTTKWMQSESTSIKDLVTTFRNAAAEEFRKLAAEQMKSTVRNLVKDIMSNFFEVKPSAEDLAKKAAEAGIAMLDKADLSNEYLSNLQIITQVQNENLKKLTDKLVAPGAGVSVNESDLSSVAKAKEVTESNESIIDTAIEAATQSTGFLDKIKEGFNSFFGPEGSILGGLQWVMTTMSSLWTQLVSNLMASASGSSGGGGGGILGTLFSIGKSFLGGLGGGGGTFLDGGVPMAGLTDAAYLPALMANGGIMTEYGALKLNKYANGGIAHSPQVAIYGEGKRPEAYVPLPDGRSIPVTMDNNSGGGNVSINITVNAETGQSSTSTSSNSSNEDFKKLGVLVSNVVKQEIINQQRSGGLLNKR